MDYNKYASMLSKYIEEATKIKESYDTAKESIVEEYELRKKVFNEVDERFKRINEGFIAGEVEKSAYKKVKKDHKRADETVKELGLKLEEIDRYMNAKLSGVFAKLDDLKKKYSEEVWTETTKLRYQLMKAKYDFLINATKVRKAYKELSYKEYQLQELSKYLGIQSGIDIQDDFQVVSSAAMEDGGAAITSKELYEALHSGQISAELEKEIKEAKEQGFL